MVGGNSVCSVYDFFINLRNSWKPNLAQMVAEAAFESAGPPYEGGELPHTLLCYKIMLCDVGVISAVAFRPETGSLHQVLASGLHNKWSSQ